MYFEFATANRILYGPGTSNEVGTIAVGLGRRAIVVIGKSNDRAQPLIDLLDQAGVACFTFNVSGEPTVEEAREGTQIARTEKCELVIAIGGGSALDTGKAISGLLTNGDDPLDFLEVIGRGKPLTQRAAPFIAIPTTAGTGSEVTRNAVLASKEHRVKVSMRSHLLLPSLAIVDPDLTHSVPPSVTASTGLDALSQVIEPFLSHRANPLVDSVCREGMIRAERSLRRAYHDGNDATARQDMALVSLFGGLALANAGLGAVHGFAGPFGGMFDAPHGATCAALLPAVMEVNLRALKERDSDNPLLRRYDEIATILTGREGAMAEEGTAWLEALCEELKVPGLAEYGLTGEDFPPLIEKASRSSSMKGNPIQLAAHEMEEILTKAM
ncbi:MAG: iron-containing alcohol dehydrogenase [Anaerolineales bacterium]|nr:iron-containing alcohol dehydrogenase [Anaerolineales bacterium]